MKKRRHHPHRVRSNKPDRRKCVPMTSPNGSPLELCVREGLYGFSATLAPKGKPAHWVPISTKNARTMKSAISAARQQVRLVQQRHHYR